MIAIELALLALTCVLGQLPVTRCLVPDATSAAVAGATTQPTLTGEAMDVVLSAEATLAWDVESGAILYERHADVQRPIASLTKLLAVLVVRERLAPDDVVEVPVSVRRVQSQGAHVRLPVGAHVRVQELLAAGLIASANDALVTLAHAAAGSEEEFATMAAAYAQTHGLRATVPANATGLSGGTQYSTAHDVRALFTAVYGDSLLSPFLAQAGGTLTTQEGAVRRYTTTNKLLGTYLPILAAKTGYTLEAKENLALISTTRSGQKIGLVILGSENRFQDAKVLAEWISRNYTWPPQLEPAL